MTADSVEISIVVRTFNEARHLPALFDAFDAQAERNFEVIVVDSGSYDRTRVIAEIRADRLIRIASDDFTFGYSLNVGVRVARGKYIVAVSAHTVPVGSDWLTDLIKPLRSDMQTAMSYGRQLGVASSRFSEAEDFERIYGAAPRIENRKNTAANNANSALRRELWQRRPFDEALLGLEDIEWAAYWMDQGYKVVYAPGAAIHHVHEESWAQIRRRYYREAISARLMGLTGRRHIPRLIAREIGYTAADLLRAIKPNGNPVCDRLTGSQRVREAIYFRLNKNIGTVSGLLDEHPISSSAARHNLLFDRPAHAVVVHGPGNARLETVPVPELTPSAVLIEVSHVAICATDIEVANGTLGYFAAGLAAFPIVPGHEFSGRVVAIGKNVRNLAEGDAVVVEPIQGCGVCPACSSGNAIACADRAEVGVMRRDGAYAHYVVSLARYVHKLPPDFDLRRAALAEPLAVVLKGLRRIAASLTGPKPHHCVVLGVGPLGHLVAKVLAHRGHHVCVIDRNPKRLDLFAGTGIDIRRDIGDLSTFDVVVEVTGNPDVLDSALHATRTGAAFLLLGLPYGKKGFSFEAIAAYDKTVIGSVGSAKQDFEAAIELLPALELSPYFNCSLPLAQFAEGWKKSQSGDVLKVMLAVGEEN